MMTEPVEMVCFSPSKPEYKTNGITLNEWAGLFTVDEMMAVDKLADHINGDLSWLTGNSVNPDDTATALVLSATYRDFLRSCFKRFESIRDGLDVADPLVAPSLLCFELLGIIAPGRREVIILGVPL